MATDDPGKIISRTAGSDMSAKQYHFVTMNDDGKVDAVASAGGDGIGILQNDPDADGKAAAIMVDGVSKCKAGGTVDEDMLLQSDASGQCIEAASGDVQLARALTAGVDGDIIEVLLVSKHIVP